MNSKNSKDYKHQSIRDISSFRTASMTPSNPRGLLDVYLFLKYFRRIN